MREITESSYEFGAEWLAMFDRSELPMPPKHLVRVIHALIEGLAMQRILTPGLVSRRGVLCSVRRARESQFSVGLSTRVAPGPAKSDGSSEDVSLASGLNRSTMSNVPVSPVLSTMMRPAAPATNSSRLAFLGVRS